MKKKKVVVKKKKKPTLLNSKWITCQAPELKKSEATGNIGVIVFLNTRDEKVGRFRANKIVKLLAREAGVPFTSKRKRAQ